jgi:hypothetical protein
MRKRHPNHRLAKIHRSYTVEEMACLFGAHKNTVRQWIKGGLPTIDDKRPMLVQGQELITFLKARRARNKQACRLEEMYCVRCRAPKVPAGGMAEYLPHTDKCGNLRGICPDCACLMHRCVSLAHLRHVQGKMEITFPQALRRIGEISQPCVNSDLRGDVQP